jgi:hypothetical protein
MTVQVATRFPDGIAAGIDDAVRHGWASTRSALIVQAVERELRRVAAQRDAAILKADQRSDDLDGLTEWTLAQMRGTGPDA